MRRPTSPIRVVTNAFFAASAAERRSNQKPMSRVGAESHQLPRHVEQQQVVRQHQHQHARAEQGVHGEVPADAGVVRVAVAHVAERVDLHDDRHECDEREHRNRQRVDDDAPTHLERPRAEPVPGEVVLAYALVQHVEQHRPDRDERGDDGQHRKVLPLTREVLPEERKERERSESEHRDEPSLFHA